MDNSNKLPVLNDDSSVRHDLENNHNNYDECLENCSSALRSLTATAEQSSSSFSPADDEEMTWERLYAPQKLREDWEAVVNKWHARLNFGSEKAQSNLRVFNQKIWEQIETNLKDEVRTIEKSRLPLHDSERIGRCHEVIIPEDQSLKGSKVDGDSSEDSDNDSDRDNDNDNAAAKKRKSNIMISKYTTTVLFIACC